MNGITVSSAGSILELIRRVGTTTRSQLADATGLARSTIADRVDQLIAGGLVAEIGEAPSSGGRPPTLLGLKPEPVRSSQPTWELPTAGWPFVTWAVRRSPSARRTGHRLRPGPSSGRSREDLPRTPRRVRQEPAGRHGRRHRRSRTRSSSRPGRAVSPPIMPGWDGYPIRDRFVARFDVPVLVDNDVNIMALGEHWVQAIRPTTFSSIKVGTGIGSGLILGGRLHRGAQGAAGDIGHVQVAEAADVLCAAVATTGCLETVAGGRALARPFGARGSKRPTARAVVALVKAGNRPGHRRGPDSRAAHRAGAGLHG